jgi:uncharacterized protein
MTNPGYHPRLADKLLDELLRDLPAVLIVGPRAAGKTTTASRRVRTRVQLDRAAEAVAFDADPDVALAQLEEPALLDEWQQVPGILGAVKRAVVDHPRPNRYLITGSVRAELATETWPGTGRMQRLTMYPMAVREIEGQLDAPAFFDRLVAGDGPAVPRRPPDLAGYVDLALGSGFPDAALRLKGRARRTWLESYIDDLLTYDIRQADDSPRSRDPQRLRRYLEAYALYSAGSADHAAIFTKAEINRKTADAYEELLTNLFVVERLPAWSTNRIRRLARQPKRYLLDPAMFGTLLRMNRSAVIRDGEILGRVIDTFVLAQLRPELALSDARPRLFHLRDKNGEHELDIVAELAGERVIGIEVKAGAAPTAHDARHLAWFRDQLGGRFLAGVVLHTGPRPYALGERIAAAPIASLWSR